MNEKLFGSQVGTLLDEAADRLPFRTVHRLDRAREAALARLPAHLQVETAVAGSGATGSLLAGRPFERLWRPVALVLPALVLAAGLYGITLWADAQDAQETAEVDAEVLVDDLPISAYADRGFGVYLNNSARQ